MKHGLESRPVNITSTRAFKIDTGVNMFLPLRRDEHFACSMRFHDGNGDDMLRVWLAMPFKWLLC